MVIKEQIINNNSYKNRFYLNGIQDNALNRTNIHNISLFIFLFFNDTEFKIKKYLIAH